MSERKPKFCALEKAMELAATKARRPKRASNLARRRIGGELLESRLLMAVQPFLTPFTQLGAEAFTHTSLLDGDSAIAVSAAGGGNYPLSVSGHAGAPEPFEIVSVVPANAAILNASPTELVVDLSDDLSANSLSASDLLINGGLLAALSVEQIDGDTVVFSLPPLDEGTHTLALAAGALEDLDGQASSPFSSQVVVDVTAPRVVASSLHVGNIIPAGPLTYVATFSEALDADAILASTIVLTGQTSGIHNPSSVVFNQQGLTLTLQFDFVPEDHFVLTLPSGPQGLRDLAGNFLDGEVASPTGVPSGNSIAGGDFELNFSVDQGAPAPLHFERRAPLGSLASTSRQHPGLINGVGDADLFTFSVQAGQQIALTATPADSQALLTLEVLGLTFPLVAPGRGESVVLPLMTIAQDSALQVRVKGDRATRFFIDAVVNAAFEGVLGDSDRERPVNLDESRLASVSSRLAAVATSLPRETSIVDLGQEVNDTFSTSITSGIGYGNSSYTSTGSIGDNVALSAPGLDVDMVQMELFAGDRVTFAINAASVNSTLDSALALFRDDGTLVALNDDFNGPDPFIDYLAVEPGIYYVGVSGFANLAYDPEIAGSGVVGGVGDYTLSISLNGGGLPESSVVVPDIDYFQLDLTPYVGRRIDAVLAGHNAISQGAGKLELLAPNGKTVVATASSAPLGVAAENWDLGILGFTPSLAGTYTLRFRSASPGSYTLLVGEHLMIEAEPNGLISDPLRLFSSTTTAIGHLGTAPSDLPASIAVHTPPTTPSPSTSCCCPLCLSYGAPRSSLMASASPSIGGLTSVTPIVESEPNNTLVGATLLPVGFSTIQDTAVDVSGNFTSATDADYFRLTLSPGDVLGLAADGSATAISVRDAFGGEIISSRTNVGFIYPQASPLPRAGNVAFATVIDEPGDYYVLTNGDVGDYTLQLRLFRPGLENQPRGTKQTLFLDFDGATIDRSIFGITGSADFDPLASFLSRWGLEASQENALIDAIMATVMENFDNVRTLGINGDFALSNRPGEHAIEIINSRDHPDPFGDPNVTRIVVGGDVQDLGITTIGLAESIDIGNFDASETAVVLLDLLSDPLAGLGTSSLNAISLAPLASKVDLIGTVVGNIAAHEAGHLFGAFHTERTNPAFQVTDQGGNMAVFAGLVGALWGDGDEINVNFGVDAYARNEVFTGTQNALNLISLSLATGTVDGTLLGPAVTSVDPLERFTHNPNLTNFTVRFSDQLAAATASNSANYELLSTGSDLAFGGVDDIAIPMTASFDGEKSVTLQIGASAAPLALGKYRLRVSANIQDADGNPLNAPLGPGSGFDTLYEFDVVQIDPSSDIFRVELRVGETAIFSTSTPFDGGSATLPNTLNPEITVYLPNGAPLATNLDSLDGKNAHIAFDVAANGVYTVVVSATSGSGEYVVSAQRNLRGNFNGNSAVDGADFLLWQQSFGQIVGTNGNSADGDDNGVVDGDDLALWQTFFGTTSAIFSASPADASEQPQSEPTADATVSDGLKNAPRDELFARLGHTPAPRESFVAITSVAGLPSDPTRSAAPSEPWFRARPRGQRAKWSAAGR